MPVRDDGRWQAAALPRLFSYAGPSDGAGIPYPNRCRTKKERASSQKEEARFCSLCKAGTGVPGVSQGRVRSSQRDGNRPRGRRLLCHQGVSALLTQSGQPGQEGIIVFLSEKSLVFLMSMKIAPSLLSFAENVFVRYSLLSALFTTG